jgi:hypothetical protein
MLVHYICHWAQINEHQDIQLIKHFMWKSASSYEELNIPGTQTDPCKNSRSFTASLNVPRELIPIIYAVHIAWDIKPAWMLVLRQTTMICIVICWYISVHGFDSFLLIFIWFLRKILPNNTLKKRNNENKSVIIDDCFKFLLSSL